MIESELHELINRGESNTLEFKSTLRYDLEQQKVNKDLAKVIPKTLAGFLNAEGGMLLIGVADNGQILGLENDISSLRKKNLDYFELTYVLF